MTVTVSTTGSAAEVIALADTARTAQDAADSVGVELGAIVKSLVFGTLLAVIATYKGFRSPPHAAGVSRSTTSTVVTASVFSSAVTAADIIDRLADFF